MAAETVLKRYLYLHAAVLLTWISVQGFIIMSAQNHKKNPDVYVKAHLDGLTSSLWLAVIAASMDVSNLNMKMKRVLASSAILFSWAQIIISTVRASKGITLGSWFLGGTNWVHDLLLALNWFVMSPSAIVAALLWIAGFLQLHAGEKPTTSSGRPKRK